jgi:uncharacterized protein
MRRRLRKKKHIGEFQEFGATLTATLRAGTDILTFLDDFLVHAVEAHGLQFGGGGGSLTLNGFVELGRRDAYLENRSKVRAWLEAEPRVEAFRFDEPVDAWAES